jgi:hypothetical protein
MPSAVANFLNATWLQPPQAAHTRPSQRPLFKAGKQPDPKGQALVGYVRC